MVRLKILFEISYDIIIIVKRKDEHDIESQHKQWCTQMGERVESIDTMMRLGAQKETSNDIYMFLFYLR